MEPGGAPTPEDHWVDVGASATVGERGVEAIEVAGEELVLWRAGHGLLCAVPRWCPHLQSDLAAEGIVAGDELVCGAHFWRIDRKGFVSKQNVKGRRDQKGVVEVRACREEAGRILVEGHEP